MPYTLTWEPHGVTKRYFGLLTIFDLVSATEDAERDVRFDTLRFAINDFLAVESMDVTEAGVKRLAAVDAAAALSNPRIKIAVVTRDERIKALTKLYGGPATAPYPTEVFETVDEARAWATAPTEFRASPVPQRA
jgi:hypothetical protein